MKKSKNYEEGQVIRILSKKRDIVLDPTKQTLMIITGSRATGDIGIKSRGKIDFLLNHCGWTRTYGIS